MTLSVKVSTKHQIVVPSEARRSLGISAGDRLDVAIVDDAIVLRPRRGTAVERLRGIARDKGWYEPDPVTYVRRIREEWDRRADERARSWAVDDAQPTSTDRDRLERPDLPDGGVGT